LPGAFVHCALGYDGGGDDRTYDVYSGRDGSLSFHSIEEEDHGVNVAVEYRTVLALTFFGALDEISVDEIRSKRDEVLLIIRLSQGEKVQKYRELLAEVRELSFAEQCGFRPSEIYRLFRSKEVDAFFELWYVEPGKDGTPLLEAV